MRTHIKNLPQSSQQKLIDDYKNTPTLSKLATRWNIDHRTIQKFLMSVGVFVEPKKSKPINDTEVQQMYTNRVPISKIAKRLGSTHQRVRDRLLKLGIPLRGNRWYDYDENYFSKIDTSEKAYWLGFLYADGGVFSDGYKINSVTVKLSIRDKEHLISLKRALGYTGQIKDGSYAATFPIKKYNGAFKSSQLRITSKKMVKDLITLGCHQNKSLTVCFPNNSTVPADFISHFIRGYFDGDGSVSTSGPQVSFLGTYQFLEEIRTILHKTIGTSIVKIHRHNRIFHLHYNGRLQCNDIGKYMYNNATVWLGRKRKKFDQLSQEVG